MRIEHMLQCLFLKEMFSLHFPFQIKFAIPFVPTRQGWRNASFPYQTVLKGGGGGGWFSWRWMQQRPCRIALLSTAPMLRGTTKSIPAGGEITFVITELTKFETGPYSSLLSAHCYCLGRGARGRGVRGRGRGGGRGSEEERGSGRLVFLYRVLQ